MSDNGTRASSTLDHECDERDVIEAVAVDIDEAELDELPRPIEVESD